MHLLHCSDVHVTEDYFALPWRRLGWRRWLALAELTVGGRHRAYRRAADTLATIAHEAQAHGADHLILSGDVTAYALEAEFRRARAALGPLADNRQRCTVIPGNHDVYTPGSHRTGRFERHFGHLLESDLPEYRREGAFPFVRRLGEEAVVVGLRSARVPPVPGLAHGHLGAAQLEGLAALVEDRRLEHLAVVVVVHHAPLTPGGREDGHFHGLRDGRALLRLLRGPRFAVLHGHIHARYHLPATDERPHLFGAGSSTEAGREGYWLLEVREGRVRGGRVCVPGASPLPGTPEAVRPHAPAPPQAVRLGGL